MKRKTYLLAALIVLLFGWAVSVIIVWQYKEMQDARHAIVSSVPVSSGPSYGKPYGGASFQSVAPMRTKHPAPASSAYIPSYRAARGTGSGSFTLHTTSSATVQSVGGSGVGGGIATGGTSSRTGRQGISYGGGTMPLLAVSSIPLTARSVEGGMTSEQTYARIAPRRAIIGGGDYDPEPGEEPLNPGHQPSDPFFTPVGNTPWFLILLLSMAYAAVRTARRTKMRNK